ncbi:hypothetical protein DPMN_089494 [Dreissena polymorpha]|uniref:Uncharacterized protein n=1 Tax=Dreissena polymorpha TaxID=45954 RepID=A0A9D4KW21_DREPO|nr:hypothetical protein DPMN_089494 [Dreissena polymorpha]
MVSSLVSRNYQRHGGFYEQNYRRTTTVHNNDHILFCSHRKRPLLLSMLIRLGDRKILS